MTDREDVPADLPPTLDPGALLRIGPDSAERRLVLLHGWGADADDLIDLGAALLGSGQKPLAISIVALQAPHSHPSGSGRQWYDLQQPNWPELPAARRDLRRRLEALGGSVPLDRTVLLGFSQGAAMAVDVAIGGKDSQDQGLPMAAVVACSGYPHPHWSPLPTRTRVLLTHGKQDPVVPSAASEALEQMVKEAGGSAQRISFEGGHGIDPSLFPAMRAFIESAWEGVR